MNPSEISQIWNDFTYIWNYKQKQTQTKTKEKTKLIDTENRWVVARVGEDGKRGLKVAKSYKLAVIRYISHGNIVYSMVTGVISTVLHICKLLRE